MSNDEPVVEYIEDLDNDVAAYYYSDEEVDPFLKQKENEKNTNKSNEKSKTHNSIPNNTSDNISANKIQEAQNLNTPNNNSRTSDFAREEEAAEDGEIDENDVGDSNEGNSMFSSCSLRDQQSRRVALNDCTTDARTINNITEESTSNKFEQARIDILGFLSDATKTSDKAAVVARLAEYFDEPRSDLLDLAVEHLNVGQLTALVLEATTIEQNGGMHTADGKRKRTFGGVFFYIMGKKVSKEAKKAIFGADQKLRKQAQIQRQRNHKQSNNSRGTHNRGRGNANARGGRGGVKRKRENEADPNAVAKKQKL